MNTSSVLVTRPLILTAEDDGRNVELDAAFNRLVNPPAPEPFNFENPERFALSWYGSGKGLGGKPQDLERLSNILHNHFDAEGHVNVVHKDFGYIVCSEERLTDALRTIALIDAPKPYGKGGYNAALLKADWFLRAIPKENFLLGQNDRRIEYAQFIEGSAVVPASADQELDWLDSAVVSGVNRAASETSTAH